MSRHYCIVAVTLLMLAIIPAWAAAQSFQAELDPAPSDGSTKAYTVGIGNVTATLDGRSLSVTGTFSGLSSSAVAGHIQMGPAMGVPGDAIGNLAVTHATSGSVSGTIVLNAKQVAALRANSLYVRIDSEKAPSGNLQGWLEEMGNK